MGSAIPTNGYTPPTQSVNQPPEGDLSAWALEPAHRAWLRKEQELLEKELDMIRVHQYKIPGGIDWWDEFWQSLQSIPNRRRTFKRNYRRKHSTTSLALVGCGSAKIDTNKKVPAGNLYSSTYFKKKKRWAELYADQWLILSAEHHLIKPSEYISPYDTNIDDVSHDLWAKSVENQLWSFIQRIASRLDDQPWSSPRDVSRSEMLERLSDLPIEIFLLAGNTYISPLETCLEYLQDAFNIEIRKPFEDTNGIGDQIGWLTQQIDDYPSLIDLDQSTAIQLIRPWTEVPMFLVREQNHVAVIDRVDARPDNPWTLTIHNDKDIPPIVTGPLERYEADLVDREIVPNVPDKNREHTTEQHRLTEWAV
jgi:hypothetical protein